MITRQHLASRWRILPADCLTTVTLYERQSGSFYNQNEPYFVGAADPRPVSKDDESYFDGIEATSKRRTWNIWTETVTAPWDSSFDPFSIDIESEWIIKDSSGNEWIVAQANSGLLNAHWKCPSFLNYSEPIIDV